MTTGSQKTAILALTGLSLVCAVSGCSSSTTTQTVSTTPSPSAPNVTSSPSAAATVYKDGIYAATPGRTLRLVALKRLMFPSPLRQMLLPPSP